MSHISFDLARARQRELLVEAERSRRTAGAVAVRRWQRRSVRLSRKAERVTRRAEQAAHRARRAVARAV